MSSASPAEGSAIQDGGSAPGTPVVPADPSTGHVRPGEGTDLKGESPLRADARRNRLQILAAADAVFAEQGIGVPVDEVARRAGVGVGTLYRHFPTKEKLFEAVIVTHMERLTDEAVRQADGLDPARALFGFLERMAEEATTKRDLFDALSGAGINVKATAPETRQRLEAAAALLLERAQRAGVVRPDVSLADLIGLVMGTCLAAESESVACSRTRMMEIVCSGLLVRDEDAGGDRPRGDRSRRDRPRRA